MKLFDIRKNKVEEVEQLPFKLERDIQNLIEPNLDTFFGLKFIKSEFTVDKYRVDTLCFNEESNSFVIIEYKKGNSYSVIDQGYTYLQLLLNHKSDFLLILSQSFNKVMRVEEIDWSQSRILFISPSFNSYQKNRKSGVVKSWRCDVVLG
jgi:RecB family endonuclease NucS